MAGAGSSLDANSYPEHKIEELTENLARAKDELIESREQQSPPRMPMEMRPSRAEQGIELMQALIELRDEVIAAVPIACRPCVRTPSARNLIYRAYKGTEGICGKIVQACKYPSDRTARGELNQQERNDDYCE
jgi:hypothetical protein